MEVNKASIKALNKGLKKVFGDSLNTVETTYKKVATEIVVNTVNVNYAWMSEMPQMREWIGKRTLNTLSLSNYAISSKKWESSAKIPLDFIRHDSAGLAKPIIQQLAYQAMTHYDELVFPLLESNGDCYDGKKFFAKDHKTHGNNTASNLDTPALSQDALLAAKAKMRSIKNSAGKPMNISPTLLVVPPALEAVALKILKSSNLANGESNIMQNIVELLVSDYLTDDKAWYLFDTKRPIKPLILQKNTPIKVTVMNSEKDELVFMEDVLRFGVWSEDNAGYGLWQLAYKSDGSKS